MHLIVYGPEGSGKGTQAELLSGKLKMEVLTSGDLVRKTAKENTGLVGEAARKALIDGKYVPDPYMYILWEKLLKSKQAKRGFILDGFPRNIEQAKFLLTKIEKYGYCIDKVIYLHLSDEEAIKRLSKRKRKLFAGSSVNHDEPVRVMKRLKVYRSQEKDLLDYFKKLNKLMVINANQEVNKVFTDIKSGLNID